MRRAIRPPSSKSLLSGKRDAGRIRTLARELVDLRPDVILSQSTIVTGSVARETGTIPIVFVNVADPIAGGLTASLARPGGNVTGFALFEPGVGGKWVELLKDIAPRTVSVALLSNPATGAPLEFFMPSIQAAATSLALKVIVTQFQTKDEHEIRVGAS
jgi:ABC-type uncharacterized transport system substrate-binding protein